MKNKILILLMSRNQPLYEQEEQACRDTFLKDAEDVEVPYYFYKGTNDTHKEEIIDEATHTMYIATPDDLAHTSKKTVAALSLALQKDWDYIIKTNVSTWLDIKKITEAVKSWEGRSDRNVYGARFIANEYSKRIPFPRGHFSILSREMVEGIMIWAPKFVMAGEKMGKDLPKTDDTLLGLSLLYHEQKILGEPFMNRLMEVPAVNSWTDDIVNAPEFNDALAIRCKQEDNREKTVTNMREVHKIKHSKKVAKQYCRHLQMIETDFGFHSITSYNKVLEILQKSKEKKEEEIPQKPPVEEKKVQTTLPPAPQPPKEPNKIEMIREQLKKNNQ